MGGTTEICGNVPPTVLNLEFGTVKIFFRSSETVKFKGFEMYIICFRQDERDLPGNGFRFS